jgi:Zn-dependent protease with chaperone function
MNGITASLAGLAPLAPFAVLAALWLAIAALVAIVGGAAGPAFARLARPRSPEARARLAWLAAMAPVLLPSSVVLLCALPGLLGALTGAGDHCTGHGDHPHFCPVHATLPLTPLLALGLASFAALLALFVVRAGEVARALARERRWLERRRTGTLAPGVKLLSGETPIALTCGLAAPEIWIAQSLLDGLEAPDRAVVLAHERAHVERRDPARFLAAELASRLHLPRVRERLLGALRLAAEQTCDARAAESVGDGLQVASTLLRVERLMQRAPAAGAFGAALLDASLSARIEALIAAPAPGKARSPRRPAWPWLLAAGALGLAAPVHHLAEHALEAVLRSMVGLALLS